MVGLTRIADHLQIDEITDDIDCFPLLTKEALLSFDTKLKDNKIFQAQVVGTFVTIIYDFLWKILLLEEETEKNVVEGCDVTKGLAEFSTRKRFIRF